MTSFKGVSGPSAGKIPSWKVNRISYQLSGSLGNPLNSLLTLKVKIFFNNHKNRVSIESVKDLAGEIAGRYLENDKNKLGLIKKALIITNDFMLDNLKKRLSCELDLGGLKQGKAKDFWEAKDPEAAFIILQKNGVVKIDYESPIQQITKNKSYFGHTEKDVDVLMRMRFSIPLLKVNNWLGAVTIKFNKDNINKPEDLTPEVMKHELEKNGRTLNLFVKAIDSLLWYADEKVQSSNAFTLDLASLSPEKLKRSDTEIDAVIKSPNESKVIDFLRDVGALRITR